MTPYIPYTGRKTKHNFANDLYYFIGHTCNLNRNRGDRLKILWFPFESEPGSMFSLLFELLSDSTHTRLHIYFKVGLFVNFNSDECFFPVGYTTHTYLLCIYVKSGAHLPW